MEMTGETVYGGPRVLGPQPGTAAAKPPNGDGPNLDDPHDPIDRGPSGWMEDPVFWLVVIAGLATGVLGVRFKWFGGSGPKLGDEAATLVGTTLYAIAGIALFKLGASKTDVPGLQRLAVFI